jgi:hypothetical protein
MTSLPPLAMVATFDSSAPTFPTTTTAPENPAMPTDRQRPPLDDLFYDIDGTEECVEERILAELLIDEVLFASARAVVPARTRPGRRSCT